MGTGRSIVPYKPGRGTGRPSAYTEELALDICTRIAGGEFLIVICRDEGYPDEATVRGWDLADRAGLSDKYKGFSAMYARARLMQIEHEVEEAAIISNTPQVGQFRTFKQVLHPKSGDVVDLTDVREEEMLGHRRLQVDTRKWRASKIAAHAYGDRLARLEGGDDDTKETIVTVRGGLPPRGDGA